MIVKILIFLLSVIHGINPFEPIDINRAKYKYRLSDKEKQLVLNSCRYMTTANYLRGIFYEDK